MADRGGQNLAPIGKICDSGNTAIFTAKGGYIVPIESLSSVMSRLENTNGPILKLNREQGVYSFDMWVHGGDRGVNIINTINSRR